ncbi:MAG: peptidylprolyl isomerase [Acidobacteria bacterium]|nr:peptidylprolyl isomerase [Acidobacteriota bacterium]
MQPGLRPLKHACFVLSMVALSSACGTGPGSGPERRGKGGAATSPVVLRVGDNISTLADFLSFRSNVERRLGITGLAGPAERTELLNHFVLSRLCRVAASTEGVRITDADRANLARGLGLKGEEADGLPEDELLLLALQRSRDIRVPEVTEEEMQAYYNARRGDFDLPVGWHVREILVDDPALARQLFQELVEGGKGRFAHYARQFSLSPSREAGGDMGTFHPGDLPSEFERVIRTLRPGALSGVVNTQYGHHIFYLEEVVHAHAARYPEVRERIRSTLRQEKERQLADELRNALFEKYRPVLFTRSLDFRPDRNLLSPKITVEEFDAH